MGGEKMEKLKQLRLKKKISYKEMADRLGISKPYYWQLENDQRRLSYDMAIKISYILKTTPDDLFYDEVFEKLNLGRNPYLF